MTQQLWRGQWLLVCGACAGVLAIAAWGGTRLWPAAEHSAELSTSALAALTQRCQAAMSRDVCGVMKSSTAVGSQERLFIAGVGEVDAQAFASLRAAGDAMCQDLAAQCKTDAAGQACKIAQALYPDLTASSAAR